MADSAETRAGAAAADAAANAATEAAAEAAASVAGDFVYALGGGEGAERDRAAARRRVVAAFLADHPGGVKLLRAAVQREAGRFGVHRAAPAVDALEAILSELSPGAGAQDTDATADGGAQADAHFTEVLASAGAALREAFGALDLSAGELLEGLASLLGDGDDRGDLGDLGEPPGAPGAPGAEAEGEEESRPSGLPFDPRPVFEAYVWEHGLASRGPDGQAHVTVDVSWLLQHGPGLVEAFVPAARGAGPTPGATARRPAPVRVDVNLGLDELQGWLTALLSALGR